MRCSASHPAGLHSQLPKKTAQSDPHFWGLTVSTQFAQQSARTSHQAFVFVSQPEGLPREA